MNNEEFWNICGLLDSQSQEDRILGMNILEALEFPYRRFLEIKRHMQNSNAIYVDIQYFNSITYKVNNYE